MLDGEKVSDIRQLYEYRIDRKLGQGGTGIVYRGIDPASGQPVAIKLFRGNFFRNSFHQRDLAKTVKKMSKLSHQNVIRMHRFIDGEEGQCIVMDYIDGPDLKWYLDNRPWNLQERLVIVAQICNGLQYLHDNKTVHHDFKPANVLFTRTGTVKLGDYSLCGSSLIVSLLDRKVHEAITPMYIAPELIMKHKATPRSDLYSLGITMYIMFAQRLPFEVDSIQRLYNCHLKVTPEPPTFYNHKCPQALSHVIMTLLKKNPAERFQDCDELRIVLSKIGGSKI